MMLTQQSPLMATFEAFIKKKKSTLSVLKPLCERYPDFSPNRPAERLLSMLPIQSLLALRQVSCATKEWTEAADNSTFSTLYMEFPTPECHSSTPTTLHCVSPHCQRLTVKILPSTTPPWTYQSLPEQSQLPAFPALTHLYIIPPAADLLEPLLAFRLFLQFTGAPLLTHVGIDDLTLEGILSLRWGPFSSYEDAGCTGITLWRGIKVLEVRLIPWWPTKVEKKPLFGIAAERQRMDRIHEREGVKILHDWVKSFEQNSMDRLSFEWVGFEDGVWGHNPLLLDEVAAKEGKGKWFSAPAIRWKSCKEICLGGCWISEEDLQELKRRVGGLERIGVWKGTLEGNPSHEVEVSGERTWAVVEMDQVEKDTVKEIVKSDDITIDILVDEASVADDEIEEATDGETEDAMTDDEIEEATTDDEIEEVMRMDDEGDLSDSSMEIHIFLHYSCW